MTRLSTDTPHGNSNPRKVFSFARPGMFSNRIVRFCHEANSWQVNRPAAPGKFNNIPAPLARAHAFAGFTVTSE